jgi:hypothetical protein
MKHLSAIYLIEYQLLKKYKMVTIGYSGKPVWQKLGIKATTRMKLVAAPIEYAQIIESPFPLHVVKSGIVDIAHCFVKTQDELKRVFPQLSKEITEGGCIWVSWYKKSAGIPTDITEDRIRDIILPTGWVDVKVCAVSEQWSGLKIVRRKK